MKAQSRRQFLQTLAAVGVAAPTAAHAFFNLDWFQKENNEFWLSAQGNKQNNYGVGWINDQRSNTTNSGFRGHGLSQNPVKQEQIVMFSRRPGTTGVVLNILSGEITQTFNSPVNHHMHGHGCFSANGKYLFCSESNTENGQGVITVRNTQNFKVEQQFSSHGIGPHEIGLMPDGSTLAVANGGLLTHPDTGRKVLNLDSMRSTLSYISVNSGNLQNELTVNEPKSSIRHLDIGQNGEVAVAIQLQRSAAHHENLVPLAAIHNPGASSLETLDAPSPLLNKLNDYTGSVRIHSQNQIAAFTSPRGNMAMFWNIQSKQLAGYHVFHDVCGLTISKDNQRFVLSNSSGKIRQINARSLVEQKERRLNFPNMQWDNHMITVANT